MMLGDVKTLRYLVQIRHYLFLTSVLHITISWPMDISPTLLLKTFRFSKFQIKLKLN